MLVHQKISHEDVGPGLLNDTAYFNYLKCLNSSHDLGNTILSDSKSDGTVYEQDDHETSSH